MKLTEKTSYKPHAVYNIGHINPSYGITIPKEFALAMGLDEPNSFVITSLVTEREGNGDGDDSSAKHTRKKKRLFLRVEKMLT